MSLIRRNPEKNLVQRRERDPFALMQEMLRWDPFRELWPNRDSGFAPSFEVKETNKAYVFKADMPGVEEEDLDVSLSGNRLTVSSQREEERRSEGDRYYTYERSYGSFSRSFTAGGRGRRAHRSRPERWRSHPDLAQEGRSATQAHLVQTTQARREQGGSRVSCCASGPQVTSLRPAMAELQRK